MTAMAAMSAAVDAVIAATIRMLKARKRSPVRMPSSRVGGATACLRPEGEPRSPLFGSSPIGHSRQRDGTDGGTPASAPVDGPVEGPALGPVRTP